MKSSSIPGAVLCIASTLAAGPAVATTYTGTLDFTALSTPVTINTMYGPINGTAGIDIERYFLGDTLSGPADIRLTTPGAYNAEATLLALVLTTNPNDALLANPAALAQGMAATLGSGGNFADVLNAHVPGWWYAVCCEAIVNPGTTDLATLFASNPPVFNAGTPYYAFIAGGSMIPVGSSGPVDATVAYRLEVNVVPEPEVWALLAMGLGLVGLAVRRHGRDRGSLSADSPRARA